MTEWNRAPFGSTKQQWANEKAVEKVIIWRSHSSFYNYLADRKSEKKHYKLS